ncbi:MAG: hypothetical protein WBJ36_12100 [Tenuifilum sp.]|uniref:OmpL47-type beta-barrel domain-containing protein n=1 Tax=Tenuifilum sp. TaxID=2760880 RepID=UPI002D0852FB|nr:hypothetical protein [Tenuifilum sp.]HOK84892.1 hypothetical protein [Tenuifilum sp.]HPP89729.1 hypothetical protein [Tenuifilum sp.]
MNRFAQILLVTLTGFTFGSFAQDAEKKTFYIDSTGNLYVPLSQPVQIYMGTEPDGSNAVLLKSINKISAPLTWNGSGPQLMSHLDLYKGRKILFELYADGIPPQTSINPKSQNILEQKDAIIIRGGSIIELNATDEAAGVDKILYSINGSSFAPYNTPINLTDDGEYEIKVYSTDKLGNSEPVVSRKIIVDATPPLTEISFKGDKYEDIFSGRAALTLTASDRFGVAGTKVMIDSSGKWTDYKQPIQTANLAEGYHTLTWYSTDRAGNIEEQKNYRFFVDKTPPIVVEEIEGNSYMIGTREFSSGRSRLKVMAVDNKAGVKEIYYSLNNREFKLYEKPVMLADILGTVKLKTYAIDRVNNRSNSEANAQSFTMPTIDITGPELGYRLNGPKLVLRDTLWIGPETKIELLATDREAGVNRIEYALNQGQNKQYLEPFVLTDDGFYKLEFTGYDNVENVNVSGFTFAVDTQAPEIYWHFSVKPIGFEQVESQTLPVYPDNVRIYIGESDNLTATNTIQYSINGSKNQNYNTPITNLKVGINELAIFATDALNNTRKETVRFIIR